MAAAVGQGGPDTPGQVGVELGGEGPVVAVGVRRRTPAVGHAQGCGSPGCGVAHEDAGRSG
ncbi:hypothetical protein [Streptomyces sp. NPDC093568]|uniref:hypothetical protein n=1 Tax=Streptomyces sp. NPDC093568 TaxID=3366041 RepID=UPI0037F86755